MYKMAAAICISLAELVEWCKYQRARRHPTAREVFADIGAVPVSAFGDLDVEV